LRGILSSGSGYTIVRVCYCHRTSPAPQPIIPVIDGFQCQNCEYITRSRKAGREYTNKVYRQKRVPDKEIFTAVQL
jgi:hypothetical protein